MSELEQYRGPLVTAVGAAFPGTRAVFHGRDIHKQVMHDTNWIQLCAVGVGCPITEDQAKLLEMCWVNSSYPDARIWNNRIASLAGSMRSTPTLALAAANAVSEANAYGRGNEHKAVAFLRRAVQQTSQGISLEQCINEHIATRGIVPGYGRPLHNGDERIVPMMNAAKKLNLADGLHTQIAFEVEATLQRMGKDLKINAGALVCAFGADFGMDSRQWALMMHSTFQAGMIPCYLEALDKPVGAMFVANCQDIDYTGPAAREWNQGCIR